MAKRKKKGSKSWYKKKCDDLFSEIVRSRGRCKETGTRQRLQCAHIVGRGYHATRFDLDNAFCLSQRRHMYYTNHPLEWEIFVIGKIGQQKYDALKKKALAYKKMTKGDYEELYGRLKVQASGLVGNY